MIDLLVVGEWNSEHISGAKKVGEVERLRCEMFVGSFYFFPVVFNHAASIEFISKSMIFTEHFEDFSLRIYTVSALISRKLLS